jgi:hypothetical protein
LTEALLQPPDAKEVEVLGRGVVSAVRCDDGRRVVCLFHLQEDPIQATVAQCPLGDQHERMARDATRAGPRRNPVPGPALTEHGIDT